MSSFLNDLMSAVKVTDVLHVGSSIYVILGAFFIAALGYMLGDVKVKGISLGTAGVFLVAIAIGCLFSIKGLENVEGLGGFYITSSSKSLYKFIQNIGLVLFVTAVGFVAGPKFFRDLKKNAHSYVLLGVAIAISGLVVAVLFALIPGIGADFSAGILSGALTSTPGYSAAEGAASDPTLVSLGHAIAYPFGVVGVVLFVQIVPKMLKADRLHEIELMHAPVEHKKKKKKKGEEEVSVLDETTAGEGENIGLAEASTENETQEALVSNEANQNEVLTTESQEKPKKKLIDIDPLGFAAFSIAIILGIALGSISIPLSSKGYEGATFSLGNTGGPLIIALILGHFGRVGRISFKVPDKTLKEFRELGLMLFLIGAGVDGGNSLMQRIAEGNFNPMIILYGFLGGAMMTLFPMVVGFLIAKYLLKIPLFNNLGSVTGGMTSTPALGALISSSGTEDVANAYAATYPIALVLVVLGCNLMVSLM